MAASTPDRKLLSAIMEKVAVSDDGCWIWQGAVNRDGYATAKREGKHRTVHKVVYEALVTTVPKGRYVYRSCRNRLCVAPAHMEVLSMAALIRSRRGVAGLDANECVVCRGTEWSRRDDGRRDCVGCARARNARKVGRRRPDVPAESLSDEGEPEFL